MATVNLGRIKFVWQGAYSGATAYVADDVVSYNGSSYICILASTNNLPTNATYWSQMSSAGTNGTNGTNGTDVGTVITTQGDLLYRDASGLQRLGAGTSGQYLKTNGSGANPAWATLSSDFVLLATTTASSSSSVSFDGYFSGTYENYKVIFNSVKASTAQYFRMRFRQSNADATSSLYLGGWIGMRQYHDGTGYYLTERNAYHNDYSSTGGFNYISPAYGNGEDSNLQVNSTANTSVNGEIFLYNPLSTSNFKYSKIDLCYRATGDSWNGSLSFVNGFITYESATALSGISFMPSTGTFTTGTFKLYGIK